MLVPLLNVGGAVPEELSWAPWSIFSGPFYGVSLFSAGVVLSVMIIPFIISISREVILAVPGDQREAALALGATRWETTWDVVVPYAKKGIMGSIFLALARALGETMAVTMVVGNNPKDQSFAVRAGLLHRRRHRQRIHRSHGETCTPALSSNWAWSCSPSPS